MNWHYLVWQCSYLVAKTYLYWEFIYIYTVSTFPKIIADANECKKRNTDNNVFLFLFSADGSSTWSEWWRYEGFSGRILACHFTFCLSLYKYFLLGFYQFRSFILSFVLSFYFLFCLFRNCLFLFSFVSSILL